MEATVPPRPVPIACLTAFLVACTARNPAYVASVDAAGAEGAPSGAEDAKRVEDAERVEDARGMVDTVDAENPLLRGLVGYWKLDEASGTTAFDSSGLGNNGTLRNGAATSTDVPGGLPTARSLRLDGIDDHVTIP